MAALSECRSPPPNNAAAAAFALSVSSTPWTNVVTSSASRFWPLRFQGSFSVTASSASISSWDRKVNILSISPTWLSSTFSHHWWKAYGDIISGSSHRASASVLPYLVPSGLVISGVTNAWACPPSARRISSTPR